MENFAAILWDANPDIFEVGPLTIRWYGLLFALGFLIGQQVLIRIFKVEGKPESDVETLTIYMVLSTIVGARLGHCLFYQPDYYLSNPIEILMIHEGGLASHGAAAGILFALWLYARKKPDQSYLWILDRMVITIALAGCFIRFGNFMNSEIIGKPADVPTSVIFAWAGADYIERGYPSMVEDVSFSKTGEDTVASDGTALHKLKVEINFKNQTLEEPAVKNFIYKNILTGYQGSSRVSEHFRVLQSRPEVTINKRPGEPLKAVFTVHAIPRHPGQLYESISCLVLFALLLLVYRKYQRTLPEGRIFGIFLIWIFGLRIVWEVFKENQVAFEDDLTLNMGQLLSIPLVIAGVLILVMSFSRKAIEKHKA